ncbi:hypothetical protein HYC85_027441 [Camellia sinensis]|uniref:Protein kinase domain-containing protein n=1 Tax=Camellia sinensis TaxID=4442 RepID=A0A7J7G6E8_CAMSI|nr:hypothetical protein HYC85_027441 [Camellia sinensis]
MSNFLVLVCKGLESNIYCLRSIKDSLEDPFMYLSSWNFDNLTEGFICKFTGIDCWHPDENKVLNIHLSDMALKGPFPRGIENCTYLTGLDLSSNELFGTIPSDISRLIPKITALDLSSNNFNGEIPTTIANLSYLNILHLDSNQLTGQIPAGNWPPGSHQEFKFCKQSLVRASAKIQNLQISADIYANNPELCGGPLPPCKTHKKNINHQAFFNRNAFFISGFAVGWSLSTVIVFALALFYLPVIPLLKKIVSIRSSRRRKRTKKRNNQVLVQRTQSPTTKITSEVSKSHRTVDLFWFPLFIFDSQISKLEKLVTRMSFTELTNATDNFSEDNIIGSGQMGTMYKALLRNGWSLAIKRFYNSSQCSKSEEHFVSEIMTLGRLRHCNLVPLIGFCYETNDILLVYKYMSNGNLYDWLHPPEGDEPKIMNWPVRVKIAVGLARGLAWLHHHSTKFQVFHHNVSSKCILLDQNFEPKISNFGGAKFINANESASGWSFSMNGELLELGFDKNDVYSFGVVLLELITGKERSKVTDDSASCDNTLIGLGFDDEIFQLLSIACKCVQPFAEQRPTMLQVYQTMRAIGERHGLVDDSGTWKQTEIATASERNVEITELI